MAGEPGTFRLEAFGRILEFNPIDESPCRRACPAGIDVKRYVGQIGAGDFTGALATIRKHMPFPSACGRICLHPCETECARGTVDQPIAIMALKRFAADYETIKGIDAPLQKPSKATGKKVGLIGSGPAGLTAAHDLTLLGHSVTVFEREEYPGGLMTQAIPEFELPHHAVHHDIERIESLGVEIKCGSPVEGEQGLIDLLHDGFDAVLIATGCAGTWKGFGGNGWIPGLDKKGVTGAVEYMRKYRNGPPVEENMQAEKTVVLGWGVQALACARTAARLSSGDVTWLVPVEKDQLQPDPRLIKQAEEEGVTIKTLARPLEIESADGIVKGVKYIELGLNEPDHTGRRTPFEKPGTENTISCDQVIDAAYFAPDSDWTPFSSGPWNTIPVDMDSLVTGQPGVFAAGDVVSGAKSVVEAVSMGHRAAQGIVNYMKGEPGPTGTLSVPLKITGWGIEDPEKLPSKAYRPGVRDSGERLKDFHEAESTLTMWQATHEARRCLLCGPCEECAVCVPWCDRKKGILIEEDGARQVIRVPEVITRAIMEETGRPGFDRMQVYVARVDVSRCRGCGVCEELCEYHAPRVAPDSTGQFTSQIDITACKGCGTCVAACPSGAIDQGVTSLLKIRQEVLG